MSSVTCATVWFSLTLLCQNLSRLIPASAPSFPRRKPERFTREAFACPVIDDNEDNDEEQEDDSSDEEKEETDTNLSNPTANTASVPTAIPTIPDLQKRQENFTETITASPATTAILENGSVSET